ncbi:hypothetical protein BKA67DRAFT_585621 [Truncatella angustata]|uniref:Uncharacterized protein n=1 Tax=Truncatella angustata TaxID=152316 RepID=A0A9P8RLT2_9PEZI|nr:uncharacterized protein BKA67DRAFT_585621 [Truncatella angustata]KAH6645580.1 hypothetical protein BKA67DRAFT_585621 [Truncatella angustata]
MPKFIFLLCSLVGLTAYDFVSLAVPDIADKPLWNIRLLALAWKLSCGVANLAAAAPASHHPILAYYIDHANEMKMRLWHNTKDGGWPDAPHQSHN